MDLTDPFSGPEASPAAPQNSNISQQWSDALGDPGVRTALLQFGLSALQPPSFGDTFGSQVGRSIGSAGEAVGRREEDARKQQETDSKAQLRDAQSTAAEARATAAGARADSSSARLGIEREKLGMARDRMSLSETMQRQRRQIDAANAYSRYLTTRSPLDNEPTLSREEFYKKSGFGDLMNAPLNGSGGAPGGDDLARAQQAIANGANPDAVRELYRSRTGQEAPF